MLEKSGRLSAFAGGRGWRSPEKGVPMTQSLVGRTRLAFSQSWEVIGRF